MTKEPSVPEASPGAGTPGQVLRKLFMDPLGLSAYRVSTDLEVPPIAISEILRGKRSITPSMALRLGTYFGVEAQFWLSLQAAHDLQRVAQEVEGEPTHTVARCQALAGREFVVRESKTAAARHWQVMITKAKAGGSPAPEAPRTKAAARPRKSRGRG